METLSRLTHPIRFGAFELDLHAQELRKHGLRVKLQGQPIEVLAMLLERPGELVPREELQKKLWPEDTFVDFEHSINAAVKRLREALSDSADKPRYIETLARRGYRFIYPVDVGAIHELPQPGAAAPVAPVYDRRPEDPTRRAALQPVEAIRESPQTTSPQITTGGFTRRAVAAVVEGAIEAHRARTRWRRLAVIGIAAAGLALGFAMLVGLNVANLRDRLVGAGLVPARGRPPGAPLPKIESIAVLPLENLSGDKEQEYFADGMTDELITNLGKISALRVISQTSVTRYKGTKKSIPEIARELNVDAVVEGTVLRSGNRVRITANLLHAPTDRHIWADSYESDLQDVLVLQGEVARAIAEEVRIKLTPQEHVRLTTTRHVNPEAYEAYMRGRYFWNLRTDEGIRKGLDNFRRATALDPNYALAYAGVADTYALLSRYDVLPPSEAMPKAKEAALKALEMDDTLAEAHTSVAFVRLNYEWDWAAAEKDFLNAIELNPGYATAHQWYSEYLSATGQHEKALAEIRIAQRLDPLSFIINPSMASAYYLARKYNDSIQQCLKVLEMDPTFVEAHVDLASAYVQMRAYDKARDELQKAIQLSPEDLTTTAALAYVEALSGKQEKARGVLRQLTEISTRRQVLAYDVAGVYAALNERELTFTWLNQAYRDRSGDLVHLKVDPAFDGVRSDPRFQDLLRRMNFPK